MTQYEWLEIDKNTYLFQSRIYTIKLKMTNVRSMSYIVKYYNPGGAIRLFPDQNIYGARDLEHAKAQALDRVREIFTTELDSLSI
jgi:hypothetical protein